MKEKQEKRYKIVHLKAEEWKGYNIPLEFEAKAYYKLENTQTDEGFSIKLIKTPMDQPVKHTQEMCGYADKLYEPHWERPCAWGIIEGERLIAAIETESENWNNRLRITELWVDEAYRRQGIGHSLLELAKEEARLERKRMVVLEVNAMNTAAIDFYLHEGFQLIGFDSCAYKNYNENCKEIRLELGYIPRKKGRLTREQLEIREIHEEDWYALEEVTQRAFWNKHSMGCSEHYMVSQLKKNEAYVPECSLVALKDGKVIGAVLYAKAKVIDNDITHNILTFGPLCIHPDWQGTGVGGYLMKESLALAKGLGYTGIVIFGEPDYYPRLGFKTCDHFGITTPDGENFDALMGYALDEEAFSKVHGKIYEPEVMYDLPEEKVEAFNKKFPALGKQYFPAQWQG